MVSSLIVKIPLQNTGLFWPISFKWAERLYRARYTTISVVMLQDANKWHCCSVFNLAFLSPYISYSSNGENMLTYLRNLPYMLVIIPMTSLNHLYYKEKFDSDHHWFINH